MRKHDDITIVSVLFVLVGIGWFVFGAFRDASRFEALGEAPIPFVIALLIEVIGSLDIRRRYAVFHLLGEAEEDDEKQKTNTPTPSR